MATQTTPLVTFSGIKDGQECWAADDGFNPTSPPIHIPAVQLVKVVGDSHPIKALLPDGRLLAEHLLHADRDEAEKVCEKSAAFHLQYHRKRLAELEQWHLEHKKRARRQVVCLCGSTRFYLEFQRHQLEHALAGRIVLSISCATAPDAQHFGHLPEDEFARVKAGLDELHLDKIALSDFVHVLNVGGYVGDSTRREVLYAHRLGRPLQWLEPATVPADLRHIGDAVKEVSEK